MDTVPTDGGAAARPPVVVALERSFGPPSAAGFGSAVFHERLDAGADLAQRAEGVYRRFVGALWDRYGAAAWMGPWREVHARTAAGSRDIVGELRAIEDPTARGSVPMILDAIDGADAARTALAAAYDDPAISELRVFSIGDGAAMSGLLVAGRRAEQGDATFLVFLMD